MTELILSIIIVLGLPGGPVGGDFDTATSDSSVAVSQVKPVKNSK